MSEVTLLRQKWGFLLGFTVITFLSRWYRLCFKSVFDDEFMIICTICRPLKDLIRYCYSDVHPPLYRVLLHFCTYPVNAWNESFVFFMRMISAVSGALLVIPVFLICDRYLNRSTAVLACLGILFSTVLLDVSQEARGYSIFCLVAMVSFYLMLNYEIMITGRKRFFYCLVTFCGLYMNYWMVFVIVSQWLLYIGWRWNKKGYHAFSQDSILLMILYLPWLVSWFFHRYNEPAFHDRISTFITPHDFMHKMLRINFELLTGYAPNHVYFKILLLGIILTTAGLGVYQLWKKDRVLCSSMLVFILLPQCTGFIHGFVLYSKYLSFIIPVLVILCAYGISRWEMKYVTVLVLIGAGLQFPVVVDYYCSGVNPYVKQDFRGLGVYLKNNLESNDHVLSYGNTWVPNFYMDYPMSHTHLATPDCGFPAYAMQKDIDNPQYKRVWLTYLTFQEKDIRAYVFPGMNRKIVQRREFGDGIQLVLLGEIQPGEKSRETKTPLTNPVPPLKLLANDSIQRVFASSL